MLLSFKETEISDEVEFRGLVIFKSINFSKSRH